MINKFLEIKKTHLIKLFIFLSFAICWQSISTKFDDLLIQKNLNEFSLIEIINFFRHFLLYLIFPILIIFNIHLMIQYRKTNFQFNDILFFFAFLYFLFQIPGLIVTNNSILNISYIVGSINLLLILNIGKYYLSNNEKKIFLYISLFFLMLIFLLIYPTLLKILMKGPISFYGFFKNVDPMFLDKSSPRATGISRTILFILLFSDYLNISIGNKYRGKIAIFIRTFCFYNIYLFQSRTMIFLMFIYIVFIFIYEDKFSLKNILKKILFYLIIPLSLVYLTFAISYQTVRGNEIKLENFKNLEVSELPTRKVLDDNFTSGRMMDWKKLSKKIYLSPLIGHGSQGDRYLINQSASNGLLYAISSSGIIGLVFFIIFSFMAFLKSILNIINLKIKYETRLISLGILIILGRSILESSYAVFSLDLILLCTIISIIDYKKINA